MTKRKNPLWKVILYDFIGVILLILVPILGPLPGPGGIPLLLAAFGFFAVNHDWADNVIHYIKKHSENLQEVIFPDNKFAKWSWDIISVLLLGAGIWLNTVATFWLFEGLGIGIMAGATTIFMLNRSRLEWLDKFLRRTGKR